MTEINFLPEEYLKAKTRRRINAICLALLILVGAGVAGSFAVTEQRRHSLNQRGAYIDQEIDEARKSLQQLEEAQARRRQITAKAKAAAALIETLPQSLVIALGTNNLPEEMMLTNYEMKTTEIKQKADEEKSKKKSAKKCKSKKKESCEQDKPPAAPKTTTKIVLGGLARTDGQVAEYVANLNRSKLLRNVNLRFCKEYDLDGAAMREFEVGATLRNHTDVQDADVEQLRRLAQNNGTGLQYLHRIFGVAK